MSEEKDIDDLIKALTAKHNDTWPIQIGFGSYINEDGPEAASEITRLRGEAEAREAEIAALVESAREAQQLYVQADNKAQRLRGEVERLTAANKLWVPTTEYQASVALSAKPSNLQGE